MLEGIFGNKTAEKVLLHIYHYGESYPSAISQDLKIAHNPVVKQLDRFERAQILTAKVMGRTRVYRFNDRFPLTSPVKELIKRVYESIPLKQREQMFSVRRRPRTRGKPVL
jgi:DNA-binding transcriptional ArsR family regulator